MMLYPRWENHGAYVKAIRDFRLRELRSESRMSCIRCGLSSVIPLPQALCVMRPTDMEIRTCALPTLDLDFLKVSPLNALLLLLLLLLLFVFLVFVFAV